MTAKFLVPVLISRKLFAAMGASPRFRIQDEFFIVFKTLLRAVQIVSVIVGFVFAPAVHADKFSAIFPCFFTVRSGVKALMNGFWQRYKI